jgi:hypothetical protein
MCNRRDAVAKAKQKPAAAVGAPATTCPLAAGGVVWEKQPGATDEDLAKAKKMWEEGKKRRLADGSKPDTVKAMEGLECSEKKTVIKVGPDGNYETAANEADGKDPKKGTDTTIHFNPNKTDPYSDGTKRDPESSLAHEAVHSYQDTQGTTPETQEDQEVSAATAENQHRKAKNIDQRKKYGNKWDIPQF